MKSMKKTLCLLLTILMMVSVITPVMANDDIKAKIDGQQIAFDVPPQLINDRTMVPLRAIFEALGATVEWNDDTQTVTSTKDGTTISLTINNPTMYVNGAAVTLDSPACLVRGRTLVPVRAISEAFGTTVDWISNENTVVISTKIEDPKDVFVENIALNATNITLIVGEAKQLNYTISPEISINKDVKWSSSNTSVVNVDDGKITAIQEGNAVITVSTDNEKYANCEVKVNPKPIQWYSSSMYRVGSDIPAGDYYAVVADGKDSGYYCKYTDSTQDDIEDNDNFDTFTFFRCYDGQYLKLSRCKITPIKNAPVYSANDGVYNEGTYRVGIDIPAGEYKFTAKSDRGGYYCAYTDITYEDIEDNDNFDDVAYYTIEDGQYLKLNRCSAVRIGNGKSSSSIKSSSKYDEDNERNSYESVDDKKESSDTLCYKDTSIPAAENLNIGLKYSSVEDRDFNVTYTYKRCSEDNFKIFLGYLLSEGATVDEKGSVALEGMYVTMSIDMNGHDVLLSWKNDSKTMEITIWY